MPGPRFLEGDRVSLHPVAEADYDFLARGWNHPDVRPGFGWPYPANASVIEERVEEFVDGDDTELFLVCAGEGGTDSATDRVGEAFVFDLDDHRGRAEIGYWVAPDHQGNGYATETVELLLAYLFDERRLHKVNAKVLAFNDGSRRVLGKAGFESEGCRREDFYVDGEYVDADLYGLLEAEWRAKTGTGGASGDGGE